MKKNNYFPGIKGFFKCIFCMKRNCLVRFHPETKKNYYLNGEPYVIECQKNNKSEND